MAKTALLRDIVEGAKKFQEGFGKHGKFHDLTDKEIKEWEKEFQSTKQIPKSKL